MFHILVAQSRFSIEVSSVSSLACLYSHYADVFNVCLDRYSLKAVQPRLRSAVCYYICQQKQSCTCTTTTPLLPSWTVLERRLPFICQHHIVCSIHIFVFIAAIICKLDVFYIPLYQHLPDDNDLPPKRVADFVCMDAI